MTLTEEFFELSPDLLFVSDPDGRFVRVNPGGRSILGFSEDQLVDRSFLDFVHPDDLDRTRRVMAELAEGPVEFVTRCRHADNSWRSLSWRAHRVDDFLYATGRDVTEDLALEQDRDNSERTQQALFERMRQGVIFQSPDGQIRSANGAAQDILGLTLDDLSQRTSRDARWRAVRGDMSDFPGEEHPPMVVLRTGEPVLDVDMGIYNPVADSYRWLRVDSHPFSLDGEVWAQSVFTDVTALREALAEADELRRAMDEHVAVSITDLDGVILDVNDQFSRISGYSAAELIGQAHSMVSSGIHSAEYYEQMWGNLAAGRIWRGETCNRRRNGELYWVLSTIVPLRDSTGVVRRYMGVRTDITMQKRAEEAAEAAALVDALTGLPNRRRFDTELRRRWLAASVTHSPLSVVMLDIDRFKEYNDTHGHQEGDELLCQIGAVLRSTLRREADLVARWGGDEFTVLLPDCAAAEAAAAAGRLVAAIGAIGLDGAGRPVEVGASAGVATMESQHSITPEHLLENADRALYRAKDGGRNQVVAYG